MKTIAAVFACLCVLACQAQTIDTAAQKAASYFKEAEIAAHNQHIWNAQLYGPTMFVDPQTRVTYANMPDSAGILKPDGDIYKGILPADVLLANTSVNWQGKLWSLILWPLPADRDERVNLVVHESYHRVQQQLGFPQHSPTADHLSSMDGRIYFLLELQALKAALSKPISQRDADLTNALLFREKRRELFPATFANERILEMNEGLAEYTGVILGRPKQNIGAHLNQIIDSARDHKSFIRSFAYTTGPVYGCLLYQKSPGWTLKIDSNSDFPLLIAKYYHISLPKHTETGLIARIEKKYDGDVIIKSEKAKEIKRLETVNEFTDLFTRKPVLTIKLVKMGISFNPSILFDLGEYGTVYPSAEIKDVWGHLTASAPGVLMKDWQVITLSAEGISQNVKEIDGKGWKLLLNDNWTLTQTDSLHYKLVNKN